VQLAALIKRFTRQFANLPPGVAADRAEHGANRAADLASRLIDSRE